MNKLYHFSDLLIKWAAYLSGILIFITTIMTFYEVVTRALFGMPTIWKLHRIIHLCDYWELLFGDGLCSQNVCSYYGRFNR